jgi:hypothetical protein
MAPMNENRTVKGVELNYSLCSNYKLLSINVTDPIDWSWRNHLAAFTRHIPQKAQISKFKTKETEYTHHFLLVDLAAIGYFITLGV